MTSYDEFAYVHIAKNLLDGNFRLLDVEDYYGFRYPLIVPTAMSIWLFGVNEGAAALFPLLTSLGNIALAYGLGRLLFDSEVGATAALLHSVFPLSVVYVTILYPDEVLGFVPRLSVLLFLLGEARPRSRGQWVLFLTSGLALGVASLLRPTALFLLAFFAAYGWLKGIRPSHLLVPLGVSLVVAIEITAYSRLVGDPFFPWRVTLPRVAADAERFTTDFWLYPKAVLGLIPYGMAAFGFFYIVALLALVTMAVRGRLRSVAVVCLWAASLFLLLNFGSTSLREYQPLHKQFRFLSVLTLPITLLIGVFLRDLRAGLIALPRLGRPLRGSALSIALLSFLILTSIPAAFALSRYRAQETAPFRWVARQVAERPDLPVYVPNDDWFHFLPFFLRHEGALALPYYPRKGLRHYHRLRLLEAKLPLTDIVGYVVLDGNFEAAQQIMKKTGFPPHWTALGSLGRVHLFLAHNEDKLGR